MELVETFLEKAKGVAIGADSQHQSIAYSLLVLAQIQHERWKAEKEREERERKEKMKNMLDEIEEEEWRVAEKKRREGE